MSAKATGANASPRWAKFAIPAGVVVVAVAIILVALNRTYGAPYNTVVIRVNDSEILMDEFIKRVRLAEEVPLKMLDILAEEEVIIQAGSREPFNVEATDANVEDLAREIAARGGQPLSDDEFEEWFRQRLNESGLSAAQYNDLFRSVYVRNQVSEQLAKSLPKMGNHVLLNMILVASLSDGEELLRAYSKGESLAQLARSFSQDPILASSSGRLGWFPRGVLKRKLDELIFSLEIGELSPVVPFGDEGFAVVWISDTQTRSIKPAHHEILKSKALADWTQEIWMTFQIDYFGLNGGYDSETDAWVRAQLSRQKQLR